MPLPLLEYLKYASARALIELTARVVLSAAVLSMIECSVQLYYDGVHIKCLLQCYSAQALENSLVACALQVVMLNAYVKMECLPGRVLRIIHVCLSHSCLAYSLR